MLEIKSLERNDIPKVVEMSLLIFQPEKGSRDSYHEVKRWQDYFDSGGMLTGAFDGNELIGYMMSCKEDDQHFHIWMCGVGKESRRKGVMTKLLRDLENRLKKKKCRRITVNTYEEKFPGMYKLLKKEDYKIWKAEKASWSGRSVVKSFFQKLL